MSNAVSLRTPKYRRHKAKGLALVTLNGRDIYLGKYNSESSKQEYRRLVAEYLQHGATSANLNLDVTVAEVMAPFLRHAKTYYRKGGKLTREYGLIVECCGFIKQLYSRTPANDFGPLALKAVRQLMIDADHSRKHINKNVERIRRMFKWAAAEELIPATIPQSLAMVAGLRQGRTKARETAPVAPVDDAVVAATLPHMPGIVADMVRLQRLTGMRPAEVCMLRPCDLDRLADVWIYRPEIHKTEHHGKSRTILIGPKGQGILAPYLDRGVEVHCFRPIDTEKSRRASAHLARVTPLSCGNRPGTNRRRSPKRKAGESYTTGSYRRAIHRASDKAGVERWAPNRLRHTAGTEVRREFGLEAAQIVLGHSKADVTQVYAERDLAKGLAVAKAIG